MCLVPGHVNCRTRCFPLLPSASNCISASSCASPSLTCFHLLDKNILQHVLHVAALESSVNSVILVTCHTEIDAASASDVSPLIPHWYQISIPILNPNPKCLHVVIYLLRFQYKSLIRAKESLTNISQMLQTSRSGVKNRETSSTFIIIHTHTIGG